MRPTRTALGAEVDRLAALGEYPGQTIAFLRQPAVLDFAADVAEDTGKPLPEALLACLAAVRYIDGTERGDPLAPTVLETDPARINLHLFFVRHHDRLLELCRARHVQSNLPDRALPVLEALAALRPGRALAVVELGCSFGLLGRVFADPAGVVARAAELFEPGQQLPPALPPPARYLGIDREIPDRAWFLAGVHFAGVRGRLARFIESVRPLPADSLVEAPAEGFSALPEFQRFRSGGGDLVVLTSYILYQLPPRARAALVAEIEGLRAAGALWLNLDPLPVDSGYRFTLEADGRPIMELSNDLCRTWSWLPPGPPRETPHAH